TAALAGKDMVDGTARLAMGLRVYPGSEQLNPAGHGAERRATGGGVGIFQGDIVKGTRIALRQALERGIGLLPGVAHGRWQIALRRDPGRLQATSAIPARGVGGLVDRLAIVGEGLVEPGV